MTTTDQAAAQAPGADVLNAAAALGLGELLETLVVTKRGVLSSATPTRISYLYEHGLVSVPVRSQDGNLSACRWDSITTCYIEATARSVNGVYQGTSFSAAFVTKDNGRISFAGEFRDPARTRANVTKSAGSRVMFQTLHAVCARVAEHQLPAAIEALRRGQALNFSDVSISQHGLGTKKGIVPWSEIRQFSAANGRLSVSREGKFWPVTAKPLGQIPNYMLLLALGQTMVNAAH